MKIYISLPITNQEKEAREKADKVKAMLSRKGWEVVNPFECYAGKNPSYGQILGYDIATLIDHCDAVYFCRGWLNSKRCRVEHCVAEVFKKKIMFEACEEDDSQVYYYR